MNALVGIGEFSRLTHLSVKALRHYHDVDVLVPVEIDDKTGYRRYGISQLPDAHMIRRLRDLDMPLDAVRTVIAGPSKHEQDSALTSHLARMETELARTRRVVTSLRELLDAPIKPLDVELRKLKPVTAASNKSVVASAEVEEWSIETFSQLVVTVAEAGLESGVAGSLFHSAFFEDGAGEVTAYLPVTGLTAGSSKRFPTVEIPGGNFACAIHKGDYQDLDRTYGALGSYVAQHLSPTQDPIHEQYLAGPPESATADYRTQVFWPVDLVL